jgi:hypothetical protein
MRPFFVVGVKLIGLLALYWALQHIAILVTSIRLFWVEIPEAAKPLDAAWNMVTVSVSFIISLGFALALLFRGERLTSWVTLPELPDETVSISFAALCRAGIITAGLLVACNGVPKLLVESYASLSVPAHESGTVATAYGASRPVESALQVGLAWLLVFRSQWVSRFIRCDGEE